MNSLYVKAALIGGCLLLGSLALYISKTPDSPLEQAAEAVLKAHGIDIDFSANHSKE